MATHWKVYRGGPTPPHRNFFRVSINSESAITLNGFTVKSLGNPEAAILMFDEQESVIGIITSNPRNPEAFPLRPKKSGGSTMTIYAAPFCRDMGIQLDRTERFDDPHIDDEGILRLDLKRTHDVSRRKGPSIGPKKAF